MKKRIGILLLMVIFLVGCNSDQIKITEGEITEEDGRVAVDIELDVQVSANNYYRLSASQDAVLTDIEGNQLRPIRSLSSSALDGTIDQSGVYSATLFFPMPEELSEELVFKIKNIKRYKRIDSSPARNLLASSGNISVSQEVSQHGTYSDLLGEYTIEFKFELDEQQLEQSKVNDLSQEATPNLTRDENIMEVYQLERVDLIKDGRGTVNLLSRD
ncbi:hypothetical protein MWH28_06100 [Natroniella sulfidigena]|uniref:hypothetical protein n=1 Tax=Natroniella sulfidigena TaxID=723921 RepID=UPI00200A1E88|nr:hypothetical protein [Natroniella sulfidigena]MCK8816946.1 hypothetical protein [Natroniella sulfidigena]